MIHKIGPNTGPSVISLLSASVYNKEDIKWMDGHTDSDAHRCPF
jgi:hypothetical protein